MDFDNNKEFKNYIKATLPDWASISDNDIIIEKLTSLSNIVFKVTSKKEVSPNPIIFRKFATKEGVVDREKESLVFLEMSKRGLGPKCYGGDDKYRLEEYFNARPIKNEEYNQEKYRRRLAISLANLHKMDVKGMDKTPLFEKDLKDPEFFSAFDKKCAEKIYTDDEQKKIDVIKAASSKDNRDFIMRVLPTDEPVFSHNDLLQGNVLIRKDDDGIILIDYEYAAYNFRGYDIGNMFRESLFDYNHPEPPYFKVYPEYYPSDEELKEFLRYYIVFSDLDHEEIVHKQDKYIKNVGDLDEFIEKTYKKEDFEARMDKLFRETKIGVMLSYYYWMVWGIKMCKTPDSDFDYIEFSFIKFNSYQKLKEEIKALSA